jgi:hypothetical protein
MVLMNVYSAPSVSCSTSSDYLLKVTPPTSTRASPVPSPTKILKTPHTTPVVRTIPASVTTVNNPSPDASVSSSLLNSSTDTVSPPPRVPSPLAFYGMLNSSTTSAINTPMDGKEVRKEKPKGATWEELVKCLEYTNKKGRVVVERVMSEEGR